MYISFRLAPPPDGLTWSNRELLHIHPDQTVYLVHTVGVPLRDPKFVL